MWAVLVYSTGELAEVGVKGQELDWGVQACQVCAVKWLGRGEGGGRRGGGGGRTAWTTSKEGLD